MCCFKYMMIFLNMCLFSLFIGMLFKWLFNIFISFLILDRFILVGKLIVLFFICFVLVMRIVIVILG